MASPQADGILGHGTKCIYLEIKSVTIQITVFPELLGSSTIKSIEMSLQDAEGSATVWRSPEIFSCLCLAAAHTEQLAT